MTLIVKRNSFFVNSPQNHINLLHQNIAGILSKTEIVTLTLKDLSENGKHIDILCLCETFIKAGQESNLQLADFTLADSYSRKKQRRGGVCIMCRDHIDFKKLTFLNELNSDFSFESCGIEISTYKCIVICIYRIPNSSPYIFLSKLETILRRLKKFTNKKIIITGDFNIDFLKPSEALNDFRRITQNYNFNVHITIPTRLTSCLDQILSNIHNAQAEVLPLGLSDHDTGQLISIPVEMKVEPIKSWFITKRDFSNKNVNTFLQCLQNISWSEVYSETSANDAFTKFHEEFLLYFGLCFPVNKIKITNKSNQNSWISKGLRISAKIKRNLRLKFYKLKNKRNKMKYLKYNKVFKKCISTAQKLKNISLINASKNVCAASWKVINKHTSSTKPRTYLKNLIHNGNALSDPIDIANAFNDYYINLTNNSIDTNILDYKYSLKSNNSSMFLFSTNNAEVYKIIKSLRKTNSVGHDQISTNLIKTCISVLTPLLVYLINLSFNDGIFPDLLKLTIIKPIHKKNDKKCPENYRPIALIPIIAKVFEKVMHSRIIHFLNKFDILCSEQNGFQKGKSTTLAAFKLVNQLINNVNKRVPTSAIFFDMSKAFDFVSHKLLLLKCETYGIRGRVRDWLESYLSNRTQVVEFTGINSSQDVVSVKSGIKINKTGVPQGSILGPLLFLIYINDLPTVTNYPCTLFADDISVVVAKNDAIDYNDSINVTVSNIMEWLQANNLKANIEKSKYVQFYSRKAKKQCLNVEYDSIKLTEENETVFLGFMLDNSFTWVPHVDKVCGKLNRFAYALWRLAKLSSKKTALQAYHGYVASNLRYGVVLWGNSVKSNRAFIAQKQCVRAICDASPLTTCRPLFRELNLLTFPCIYIYEICCFVKTHHSLFNLKHDVCHFNTRFPNNLILPAIKTEICSRNSYAMSVRIYNKMPDSLKELPLYIFKKKLTKWLIGECFYSVSDFLNTGRLNL